MPFHIVRNDITKMRVDAIVNAANHTLLGGGGVDGAIHKAAGPGLLSECRALGGCETGKAKITLGYNLPAKHVIHTVGPVWQGGHSGEDILLASCYRESLSLALSKKLESVAFPLISTGIFGYPKEKAFRIASNVITDFVSRHDITVYLVIFDRESFLTGSAIFPDIAEYIDDRYAGRFPETRMRAFGMPSMQAPMPAPKQSHSSYPEREEFFPTACKSVETHKSFEDMEAELKRLVSRIDESFTEMLLRKIDERGMKDSECYKKANIDRKLFSKIRSDRLYKPSKPTAVAFAIALEMSYEETEELLKKAGYAFSGISTFDVIIEYFIRHRFYSIHAINEALFAFDQSLLGC